MNGVSSIDLSGANLLVKIQKDLITNDISFKIRNPSGK